MQKDDIYYQFVSNVTNFGKISIFDLKGKEIEIITIDIFCKREPVYKKIKTKLTTKFLYKHLNVVEGSMKIYNVDNLKVVKISVDRFFTQGSRFDRDIHGAQLANLISELMVE